jgi:predicted O-methyltransferase YrrM
MTSDCDAPPQEYQFSTDWFSRQIPVWRELLTRFPPSRYLEVGSYEGRSACFVIDHCGSQRDIEVHCIDTWAGGVEHDGGAMPQVEDRFSRNIELARGRAPHRVDVHKHKALSSTAMINLLAQGRSEYFDAIYIDGSHQAADVLTDSCLAWLLLKVGGIIIFDDYLWSMEPKGHQDFYNMPKPAIDAFLNIYQRKLSVFEAPLYQIYARKISR